MKVPLFCLPRHGTRMGRSPPKDRHQPQAIHVAGRLPHSSAHHTEVVAAPQVHEIVVALRPET